MQPFLFNSAANAQQLKDKWGTARFGLQLGGETYLSNLRFADDVLLMSSSLEDLVQMLTDLSQAAKEVGLELHPKKTKILSNIIINAGGN